MAATYPSAIRVFDTKVNFTQVVEASHPNSLQEEVVAVQTALGTAPAQGTVGNPAGVYNNTGPNWGTVKARLANIEQGIVADTHNQYVKVVGGSTITPSSPTTAGLTLGQQTGQSGNLLRVTNAAGTLIGSISPSGILNMPLLQSAGRDVATVTGSETLTNKVLASPTLTSPVLQSPTIDSMANAPHTHRSASDGGRLPILWYTSAPLANAVDLTTTTALQVHGTISIDSWSVDSILFVEFRALTTTIISDAWTAFARLTTLGSGAVVEDGFARSYERGTISSSASFRISANLDYQLRLMARKDTDSGVDITIATQGTTNTKMQVVRLPYVDPSVTF